jgi:ferric iron reductase protein FhuF
LLATPAPTTHSLAATLGRVARLGQDYELRLRPEGDGWVEASEIVEGGPAFERAIAALAGPRPDPAASRALGSRFVQVYLGYLAPVVAAFALERTVPDVAADNLLVRLDSTGWPTAFALASPRFATLAGSPSASEAATVLPDGEALSGWLNERAVEANVARLITTVQARLRTSPTTLWGSVAEAFAKSLLWHVQHVAPESAEVVRDADVLLHQPATPHLADQVRLLDIVAGGDEWRVAARRSCCLRWCLPGGARCEDCPLQRDPGVQDGLHQRLNEAIARGRVLREDPELVAWAGRRSD